MNVENPIANTPAATRRNKLLLLQSLAEKKKRLSAQKLLNYFQGLYVWQNEFVAATKEYYECCLMAANQIGKTRVGTVIDAMHLSGEYPEEYPGHRFDFAPVIWCLGYSMEKTRDLLQEELFGSFDSKKGFEGGLIAKEKIISWESATGTPNAMRTVRVKHLLGTSVVQFWSYSQGQHAIMGDVVDWVHVDEEPKDQTIRPQLITRTSNGNRGKGGRIIYTFTPENGRTDLVIKFMDNPSATQFYMQKGWKDAPHMTHEKIERMLEQYPDHQKAMRSEGDPMLGHGRIYDIADDFILCDPFEPPIFWDTIAGMDFGWDHPQAFVKLIIDPDSGCIYLTNSWKASKVSANDAWGATKSWMNNVPVAWPQDGLQHEKGRDKAEQQKNHYVEAGFKLLGEHATWLNGSTSVESGLYDIADMARKGLFKVFKGNIEFMDEWRLYHRDDKQKIVKVKDDMLDAARTAFMMRRCARKLGEIAKKPKFVMPTPIKIMGLGVKNAAYS